MTAIEATFPFNEEVLGEAYALHRSVRRWPKLLAFLAWVALASGAWLLIRDHNYLVGGIVAGVAAATLLLPRLNRALWLQSLKQNPWYGAEVRCRFDTSEMLMAANGKGLRLRWEDTFKIVDGPLGYLIYPKAGAFYYIPARGFATDIDAERVKGFFLSEKMRKT